MFPLVSNGAAVDTAPTSHTLLVLFHNKASPLLVDVTLKETSLKSPILIFETSMYCLVIMSAFQVPAVNVPTVVISLPFTLIACVEPSAAEFVMDIPVPAD